MKYSAIVLCAGSGSRTGLGYNKMFYQKDGETVYQKTMKLFLNDSRCHQIIVVCKQEEMPEFDALVSDKRIKYCIGGKERQDSVYAGLQVVNQEYVFIHDGARPYVARKTMDELCQCVEKHKACLVMVPSIDTLKEVVDGIVVKTPARHTMMNAQTPQVFETNLIKEAYQKGKENNFVATDDSSLVEMFTNKKVYVVVGDYENKKITTPSDL
ncbi:2-C-methyl-D-erythritol 4-phosphate cytidylyltransferase [Tannockella kyphosi]|uniref:2-C-methyl-D-erythritol 4-phosphate cytidylyltransferase n=1 Tax=Tannockella kyphosi TaxID=2899121 RepID=UPI002011AEB8|nr:2-C-methyl-D-erythritol 4-phosphate cytidylyltransferase [Tannockella kyphosi]